MRLGVDFGTTNSSVAYFDEGSLHRINLDPSNDNPNVLPSLLYINREQQTMVGTKAAREYLQHETGRRANWEKKRIGEIDVTGADMSFVRTVHAMVDTAATGRLLQYVKTALRDPSYHGTQVFDRFYTVDELIAILLRELRSQAERACDDECDSVVIGRPVRFSSHDDVNERAEEIVFKGARRAGFADIRFELEPVGAAYFFHRSADERQTAFVFDFGGGTLDFTIAQVGGGTPPAILGTHGVLVGGDDLDRCVMQSLHRHFGSAARLDGKPLLPPYLFDWLDNWQTMPILSRPDYVRMMDQGIRASADRKSVSALKSLVTRNLGFQLFREIESAKKHLSDRYITHIVLRQDAIDLDEALTRGDFEKLIKLPFEQVVAGIRQALEIAQVTPADIDIVLRTGGTSAVPVFTQLLAGIFGEEKLAEMDLLMSVVGGLAIVAAEGGGVQPAYSVRYGTSDTPIRGTIRNKGTRPCERYEFSVGARCYVDHSYTLKRIPVDLSGLPAIRTAQQNKDNASRYYLQMALARPTRIFVSYDASARTLPDWLREFEPLNAQVAVDQFGTERLFRVYAKDFPAGQVDLGGNCGKGQSGEIFMNYLTILAPAVSSAH